MAYRPRESPYPMITVDEAVGVVLSHAETMPEETIDFTGNVILIVVAIPVKCSAFGIFKMNSCNDRCRHSALLMYVYPKSCVSHFFRTKRWTCFELSQMISKHLDNDRKGGNYACCYS